MGVRISAIEYFLPEQVISSEFLAKAHNFDLSFIEEKLGIHERHIISGNESCFSMARNATQKLFDKSAVDPTTIDLLCVITQNPDYQIPNIAPLLQHSLGLRLDLASFDMSLGCSGFVYALATMKAFMSVHSMSKALIVTSDPYSRIISPVDRSTAPLFGDAAAAILIERCPTDNIGEFDFGTDGSGAQSLIIKSNRNQPNLKEDSDNFLFMDGSAIYKFMMTKIPKSIRACLSKNNLQSEEIDFYIFHQASKYMVLSLAKQIKVSHDKIILNIENHGNTVSSSIPIALKPVLDKEENRGKKVLLSGFGVGLSWASTVISI
jgi:3-oxoacyl-[acyl-carrier-protein] synthase-3